jgi:hypothetical protein
MPVQLPFGTVPAYSPRVRPCGSQAERQAADQRRMLRTPVGRWIRFRLRQGYSPTEIVLELGRAVDNVVDQGHRAGS